jgi:hypothetical protein
VAWCGTIIETVTAFGVVVRIEQVSTMPPLAFFQRSQIPGMQTTPLRQLQSSTAAWLSPSAPTRKIRLRG